MTLRVGRLVGTERFNRKLRRWYSRIKYNGRAKKGSRESGMRGMWYHFAGLDVKHFPVIQHTGCSKCDRELALLL